jgi:hypothetical protein
VPGRQMKFDTGSRSMPQIGFLVGNQTVAPRGP